MEAAKRNIISVCLLYCGLNKSQLAKELGVARTTLWYWQTGKVRILPEQLHKIRMLIIQKKTQEWVENY